MAATRSFQAATNRLLRVGAAGLGSLPPRAAYALADAASLAVLAWSALHERRVAPLGRGLSRNQRIVYRDALDRGRARELRRAWARHLARLAVDLAALSRLDTRTLRERVDLAALEGLRELLARGRGLIAVSGHIGVWELLSQLPALGGLPLTLVARRAANRGLETWLSALRGRSGARVVPQRGALRPLTLALARGEIVGLLADEDTSRRPVFTPFLGTAAATSRTFATLQRRTGAPIAVVTCHRTGTARFRLGVWERIEAPAAGGDADPARVCGRVNAALSRAIRSHPEQWLWASRRFLTRPPGERAGADGLPPRAGG